MSIWGDLEDNRRRRHTNRVSITRGHALMKFRVLMTWSKPASSPFLNFQPMETPAFGILIGQKFERGCSGTSTFRYLIKSCYLRRMCFLLNKYPVVYLPLFQYLHSSLFENKKDPCIFSRNPNNRSWEKGRFRDNYLFVKELSFLDGGSSLGCSQFSTWRNCQVEEGRKCWVQEKN